jgi:hypothetical protein
VPLVDGNFNRVVISSAGVTFHWNEGQVAARMSLQQATTQNAIENVDGAHPTHDLLHPDDRDAATPALHGHFLGDVTTAAGRAPFLAVLEALARAEHITVGEMGRIAGGFLAYERW